MADITTRETSGGGATVKGSPLTNTEVDTNFINLNTDKVESGGDATLADVTVDSLQFTGGTGTQGTVSWNVDEETLDVILDGATLQMGQEVHYHVRNNTASTISNGTPVMVTGTIGASGRLTIAPMDATNQDNGIYYIGVTTEDIAADADGKATHFGKVRGLDTSAFADGDVLWLSTSTVGAFTATEPSTGIKIPAAIVINSHASTGTLFCRYQGGYGIHDMHDFDASVTPVDNDVVAYDATSGTYQPQSAAEAGLATAAQGSLADTALQTETDTLDSVTGRGATTSNAITVGNLTSTGIDDNATSTAITIDANEHVGIGTVSPTAVKGGRAVQAESNTGAEFIAGNNLTSTAGGEFIGAFLFKNSDTSADQPHYAGMWGKARDSFGFTNLHFSAGRDRYETDVTDMFIQADTGNVGIGTSDPSRKLHVLGTTQVNATVETSNTRSYMAFVDSTTVNSGALIGSNGDDFIVANGPTNSEKFRIDTNGNVSIAGSLDLIGGRLDLSDDASPGLPASIQNTGTFGNQTSFASALSSSGQIQYSAADHLIADNSIVSSGYPGAWLRVNNGLTFGFGTSTAVTINSSQKVGIGTTDPSEALTIAKSGTSARISLTDMDSARASMTGLLEFDGTDSRAGFIGYDAGDMSLYAAVGDIKLSTGGAARLTIEETTGHLRIGDSANRASLRLENTAQSGFSVGAGFYTGSTQSTIEFQDSNTTANYKVRIGCETDDLLMFAGGSERMRIDASGNVGIGTSTISGGPASTLHVHSSVSGAPVPFGSESRITVSTNDTAAGNQGFLGSLFFGGQDVSSEQTAFTGAGVVGYAAGDLAEGNITADLLFYTQFGSNAPTEKMRIDSGGVVRIGGAGQGGLELRGPSTGTEGGQLDIQCAAGVGSYSIDTYTDDMRFLMSPTAGKYQWYCNNNSIIGMTLEASGNLLLGTSSTSSARLHVENTTGTIATFKRTGGDWAYVFIEAGSTTGNSRLYFSDGASAEGGIDYEHSVDAFRLFAGNTFTFDTAGSEQMRIDSNGNVGIGTDNPIYPLDVNGAYRHGDERTIYQAGGGATTYWFKIYEKHYRTPNAFEWDIAEVDYYGGGQTGAAQYACRLLINIKQQQASDLFQVVMYESINMNNQVAYKFDSTGGDASNGLLEVWIRQPTTYVTNAIFVRRLYNPGILSGGAFSMTSTGSTTQPAGSTLVTGSSY